jgi:hypothetical protein
MEKRNMLWRKRKRRGGHGEDGKFSSSPDFALQRNTLGIA